MVEKEGVPDQLVIHVHLKSPNMKTLVIALFLLSTTIVIDGARLSPQDKNLVVDVPYGPRHAMFNFDEVSLERGGTFMKSILY